MGSGDSAREALDQARENGCAEPIVTRQPRSLSPSWGLITCMQANIDQQTQEKIRQVSEETGIPEPEVLDRALDMLLLTEEMHGLRELKDDLDFWQQRYFDTLALEDERIAKLDYDQGGTMGH